MKAETQILQEKIIYPQEFHVIKDNENTMAYNIENMDIIQLDHLEFQVLNSVKESPRSISELKKRLSTGNNLEVEAAVNELVKVNLLGYTSMQKMSPEQLGDFETKRFEALLKNDLVQIALNVTHQCPMACDYCYGDGGSYGGPAVHMTKDTAERAVDFLLKISSNAKMCRITLFGGEPLLNFNLVKHVVRYARKQAAKANKEIMFGMTTNGMLLDDEKIDFIIKEKIEVTFSVDGPKPINDKNRTLKANREQSTYDLIYPKILKFIEKAEQNKSFYAFRATLTSPSMQYIDELVEFFKSFNAKQVRYDPAEYKKGNSPADLAITDDDLNLYRQKVKRIAGEIKKDELKENYDLFSKPLQTLKKKMKQLTPCKSLGALYVGVSAEGDIFPCHRFVGYKQTKLGNVRTGFDREKWLKRYAQVHIFNSKVCSSCWARYFCGGLCPATSYFLGGDMVLADTVDQEPVHCKLKKIVYEEAMLLFSTLSGLDE